MVIRSKNRTLLFPLPSSPAFINWFLSREGQMTWQKVLNAIVVNGSDSMRIDIPKHDVLPGYRRAEGRQYPMLGFVDPKPAGKYYWELVEKAGLEKGKQRCIALRSG
jgi:hypothetical protein